MSSRLAAAPPVRHLVCVSVNAAIDKTASVDHLVPGEIHRPEMLAVLPGGKSLNVARAARTLGLDVSVLAVLGGRAGDWMEEALAARAIRTRAVRVAGETRTCLSVLDQATGSLTEFYEAGLTLDTEGWAAVETALASELAEDPAGTIAVIAGSLPPGAPVDGYGRLAALAAGAGARAVVDVGGAHLAAALSARPWLVKVNAGEAAEGTAIATPDEPGALAAAHELRARGALAALVTRGVAGALLVDETGAAWRIGPPPELGRFVVGSGDAFLAGLIAALASGHALAEAARHGAATACANALRPGQGELDPGDAARVLGAVSLTRA
ncbi:MAG TPA: hexose kinase [Patescibacteria group bacterium]|nr:hexose kinase [Patescibacteria group bacterium]